jgi:hypothetical protein
MLHTRAPPLGRIAQGNLNSHPQFAQVWNRFNEVATHGSLPTNGRTDPMRCIAPETTTPENANTHIASIVQYRLNNRIHMIGRQAVKIGINKNQSASMGAGDAHRHRSTLSHVSREINHAHSRKGLRDLNCFITAPIANHDHLGCQPAPGNGLKHPANSGRLIIGRHHYGYMMNLHR